MKGPTARRSDGTTVRQRVYRALCAATGTLSSVDLAVITGELQDSCRKACQDLAQRGYVVRHGKSRWMRYSAVAGKREPADRRGKSKACRNHRGAVAWANWYRMMRAKHGPAWRPRPSHPLDALLR